MGGDYFLCVVEINLFFFFFLSTCLVCLETTRYQRRKGEIIVPNSSLFSSLQKGGGGVDQSLGDAARWMSRRQNGNHLTQELVREGLCSQAV